MAKCEHNRNRSHCKECHGGSICEHDRQRSVCSRCCPDGAYKVCVRKAAYKEISFELPFEDFKWIVSSSCLYCGESVQPMTCDRVDSSKGYSFENIQPLCNLCNIMKLHWSEEQFEEQIIKIIQHRPELIQRAGFPIQQS